MALSPTVARALEQAKMGLYMLRGADYFTEDEWIKIDGLIHKGQYVFTNGPQMSIFDGELINFDDTVEDNVQIESKAFDPVTEEPVKVPERELPSATMSDSADILDFTAETPNTTSAEASSDDELSFPNTADTSEPEKASESATNPTREPVQLPKNGGLALGYSQALVDEIKAFNSTLTKAGKKSRPGKSNRSVTESHDSMYDAEEPSYSAATPMEKETHNQIQTWASDVHSQKSPQTPTVMQTPSPTKTWTSNNPPPAAKSLVEDFKEVHGRRPSNVNDLVQPKNPAFEPLTARPFSRVSQKSAKSTATSSAAGTPARGPGQGSLNVKPGTLLIAQRNYVKKSAIQLDIKNGDQIVYMKHVSAATHVGENKRTGLKGQFFEDVLKKDETADSLIQQQRARVAGHPGVIGDGRHVRQVSVNTVSNTLERMEALNAAEWDDVASVATTNTINTMVTRARPTIPSAKSPGGLGASRFASEEDKPSNGISKEELGQLIDQKFAQILAAQAARGNSPSVPSGPSRPSFRSHYKPSLNEPLKKVQPKSATCWWWATPNKECRFTDDECRDLHGYLPSTATDPANLRMGKPTWGALADSLPPQTTTSLPPPQQTDNEKATEGINGAANFGAHKSKTCWYWANDPKGCSNSATDCKYLHEKCAGGVANRPASWKKVNWSRFNSKLESGSSAGGDAGGDSWTVNGDGETDVGAVEEWNGNGNADGDAWGYEASTCHGWGEESNTYRPPHIKALEEKALAEAIGW